MKRVKIPHRMDESATKWMFKFFHANQWRLPEWMDWDDFVKMGEEAYYEARHRYPTAIDRPHIMRLFQLVLFSRVTSLATRRSEETQEDKEAFELASIMYASEDPPIELALDAVPLRFRALLMRLIEEGEPSLAMLAQNPSERARTQSSLSAPMRRTSAGLETLNDRLCELGGFERGTSVADTIRSYLTPQTVERKRVKYRPQTGEIVEKLQRLGCSPKQIERHIRNLRSAPRYRVV